MSEDFLRLPVQAVTRPHGSPVKLLFSFYFGRENIIKSYSEFIVLCEQVQISIILQWRYLQYRYLYSTVLRLFLTATGTWQRAQGSIARATAGVVMIIIVTILSRYARVTCEIVFYDYPVFVSIDITFFVGLVHLYLELQLLYCCRLTRSARRRFVLSFYALVKNHWGRRLSFDPCT